MYWNGIISSFGAWWATRNIKRYILKSQLIVGSRYSFTLNGEKKTVKTPPDGKIKLYNSVTELRAGKNDNGVEEFIPVIGSVNLGDVILQPETTKDLMELDGNPVEYLASYAFNCSIIRNGKRKFFRYTSSQMFLYCEFTTSSEYYLKVQQAAKFEAAMQEFIIKAKRNAKLLGDLYLRNNLNQAQRAAVTEEIKKHQAVLTIFKNSLPEGVHFETRTLSPAAVKAAIGVIPVVVWAVAAVITAIGVTKIVTDHFAEVAKHKQTLDARYQAIMSIENMTTRDEALTQAANTDNNILYEQAKAEAASIESGGILGQVKQIMIIGAIVYVAKTIFSK